MEVNMKAIILGITTGGIVKILTGNIGMAILTALCTGSAAFIGQQVTKYVYYKIKKRL